jgi:TatA/E family protein of Tat protein translocase
MLRGIGLPELVIILAIILLLFGAARLPQIANSMGKAIKEFRKAAGPDGDAGSARSRRRGKMPQEPPGQA